MGPLGLWRAVLGQGGVGRLEQEALSGLSGLGLHRAMPGPHVSEACTKTGRRHRPPSQPTQLTGTAAAGLLGRPH